MNPEIKAKWVQALRSGEYQQGKECLRSNDKFCCLGVLADLYIKSHEDSQQWESEGSTYYILYEDAVLPEKIQEWAGMPTATGDYRKDGFVHALSLDNDSNNKNFLEIADIIEANF